MKKLILSILLLAITFSYAQFEAKWEMNLQNDYHKEIITLTKNGNKVTGTLLDGGKLTAIWDESNNKLTGYFRFNKKITKFNASFKNRAKKVMLVGKYCACSGTPTKYLSFVKIKNITWREAEEIVFNKNINMQGTWSSDFGILRLHQNGKKITGDYKHVGVIKGTLKDNKVTGTFTNGNKTGIFEWTIISKTEFKGKWAWKGQTLKPSWNATLKNKAKPTLKNSKNTNSGTTIITRRNGLENTTSTNNAKKPKDYSGRYRITVTNIYTTIMGDHLGIENNAEIYGIIGVRLKGKGNSGNVEIKSIGNKKARIWDFNSGNAIKINQVNFVKCKNLKDPTGQEFSANGTIEVDKIREFSINGELANDMLMINLQINLKEVEIISNTRFGWKQRNLYIKDMQLGKEYLLIVKKGNDKVAVGYILEKI